MPIIARIRFPAKIDVAGLYVKTDGINQVNYCLDDQKIILNKNSLISLNTYFNSFYETFYVKYTKIESIYYLLKLEGDFRISAYREFYGQTREIIQTTEIRNCHKLDDVKFIIPDFEKYKVLGRLYLEIVCLGHTGIFWGGFVATDKPRCNEVYLGIVTCTFKKEAYVLKTIKNILEDSRLSSKDFSLFIIDNGNTLNESEFNYNHNEKVKIIFNKNSGGSGGFNRGLLEVLNEDKYSHILLMDDDIELDSESIYRLFALYEYAREDFAVAGSMLDLYEKHMLYEAGALYCTRSDRSTSDILSIASLKNNLYLQHTQKLNFLLIEEAPDYGAFWFFCMPKIFISQLGLLMPFFVKMDDIEFGLRIKEKIGEKIVPFPSIAVWHEPFYAKLIIWDIYYFTRNALIVNSIYQPLNHIITVKRLTRRFIAYIFIFDYNSAEMILKAFEDYLKGDKFFRDLDFEKLHFEVINLSKSHKSRIKLTDANYPISKFYEPSKISLLKLLLIFITLNNHLLPEFLIRKEEAFIVDGFGYWHKTFRKNEVVIFKKENGFYKNILNKSLGINMLIRWLKLVIKSRLVWSCVNLEWKKSFKEFTSITFWNKYFSIKIDESD